MSGMSFEGIAHTDGRYGFVVLLGFVAAHWFPATENRTLLAQVYSTARVSTLLSVILNMVGMDNTSPLDCQASPVAYVWSVILSDDYVPKGLDCFPSREPYLYIPAARNEFNN